MVIYPVRNRTALSYLTIDLNADEVFCFPRRIKGAKFALRTHLSPEDFLEK